MKRRLPRPFEAARVYVSSEGGLRYLRPSMSSIDPLLLRLAAEIVRPNDVVWDIGANVGLFSFSAALAAGRGGHVLALEPDAVLVEMLRRSATLNQGFAPVLVLPVAAANAHGISQFLIARRNRSTSHLEGFGTSQTGGVRSVQLVPTVTLDWLTNHFPMPTVVKIDVEAAELKVLEGGLRVLRSRPLILCEVAGNNGHPVAEILTANGYTLYDARQPPSLRTPVHVAPPDTLAVANGRS